MRSWTAVSRGLLRGASFLVTYQHPLPFGRETPPVSSFEDDASAIRRDWETVGNDLRGAMAQFERERPAERAGTGR